MLLEIFAKQTPRHLNRSDKAREFIGKHTLDAFLNIKLLRRDSEAIRFGVLAITHQKVRPGVVDVKTGFEVELGLQLFTHTRKSRPRTRSRKQEL